MFPMNNLSNLQALRMSVFGTPHGPFQNPGMPQAMPFQHPMLPAPNLMAGPVGGMPPAAAPVAQVPASAAAPVQGTMMRSPMMPAPQFPQLNALQSLAPQNMMRRGPMMAY